MKQPYRVLIVDDSAFMRKMITEIISEDAHFTVIYAAKDGMEAVQMANELKPDVITMDIEMPVMNGLKALEIIMRENPTPVIMLSSVAGESAEETLHALDIGAVDFIQKPSGNISFDLYKIKSNILEKLYKAIETKPQLKLKQAQQLRRKSTCATGKLDKRTEDMMSSTVGFNQIVAIGTSTGGPRALQSFITKMPRDFPAPILIVQHMPPKFTKSLAERLDLLADISVKEAEDGCVIRAGHAYLAPGGWHMMLDRQLNGDYCLRLSKDEPRNGHRPSVNVLFDSMLPFTELTRHSVMMTGMGNDGADGMKALFQANAGATIAQSMETCVVYGMPRTVIEMGVVQYILPLEAIAGKVIELVKQH